MDDEIKDDLDAFRRADEAERDQRQAMLEVLEFVKLSKQWPKAVKTKRENDGRPCLTINRLPAFGRQVINDARQNRPAIKVHPVGDGADTETAEIFNGLIKQIEISSNADVAYDTALDFSVNCGVGYATVNIDYADDDSFDKDVRVERVSNPFAVYGDPASTAADSSDWNSAFITDKLSDAEFKKRYPDASVANFEVSDSDSRDDEWYEDGMVQIAERWIRERVKTRLLKLSDGSLMMEPEYLKIKDVLQAQRIEVTGDRETTTFKVSQRIISGAEVLERNDWRGKYIPIIPCFGDEINVNGKRSFKGLFNDVLDAQRNYNYWRSASTELVALAPKTPFIGPAGAFDTDSEKWSTANVDSHAFIQFDGQQAPQRQPFAGAPAGTLQEALNASDDLKNVMGLHDASLGVKSNETSGRAIMARQREGDVSTFHFIDNQRRFIQHIGKVLVDLIPKVYDVPRVLRVFKDDKSHYTVPVNQPVQQLPPQPQEDGSPPMPGQPPEYKPVDEDAQEDAQGLIKVFDLTVGKYDVTCESGPSFTTRREESAQQMMQYVQANPQAAPIIGDLIAKSLDWPGADEIAKRLQGMLPPGAAGKNPQLMQAEQAIGQLKQQLGQMQQQLNDKQAELQIKNAEVQIKQMDAQTKQFQAQAAAQAAMQPVAQAAPVDHSFDQWKLQFEADMKMKLEDKNQEGAERLELIKQGQPAIVAQEVAEQLQQCLGPVMEQVAGLGQGMQAMQAHMTAPRKKIRDASGRLVGVEINGTTVPIGE
jgi:hypothetical protein